MGNSKQYLEDNKEQIREKAKQYRENNKEKIKQYRENNKEQLREKKKQYRENNKEKTSEKFKQYYQDNKTSFKQYYQDNKEQIKEKAKQYRKNNKEKLREKGKQYRENNREKIKQYNKKIWHDVSHPAFFTRRLSAIKSNAKCRSLDFDLDAEYLKEIWPEDGKCAALGFSLRIDSIDRSPSLDRIDNTKGYTKGNVHWVSLKANRIMSDGTPEEVMKVALFFQQITRENENAG